MVLIKDILSARFQGHKYIKYLMERRTRREVSYFNREHYLFHHCCTPTSAFPPSMKKTKTQRSSSNQPPASVRKKSYRTNEDASEQKSGESIKKFGSISKAKMQQEIWTCPKWIHELGNYLRKKANSPSTGFEFRS